MKEFRAQERVLDTTRVFQVVSTVSVKILAGQLQRRERWILLLLDGKRNIVDLAHLTQRSELDVASTLTKFLQQGIIAPVAEHSSQ
jgi:aminopeptidase-like protein